VLPERVDLENGGYYIYRLAREREAPLPTPPLPGIEGAFSSVEGYLRRGERQKVSTMVGVLESVAGDFPAVKYFVGMVWYGRNTYRSYEYLRGADEGGLRDLDMWKELARLAEARWQVEEALMYEEKIARFEPRASGQRHYRLLVRLAKKAMKKRKLPAAEDYLRRALDLEPGNAARWADLSSVLRRQKRRIGSEVAIRNAIKLDPDNAAYRKALREMLR